MKTNFRPIARPSNWIFKTFFFSLFIPQFLFAQNLTKTFVKEIEVSENAEIFTNTPIALPVELHGTMSTNFTAKAHTIVGKDEELSLHIDRRYEIKTWDKNLVRQEIEVTIVPENQSVAKDLLSKLKIDLYENPANEVHVNSIMNIHGFELRNGFMRDNKSTVELNDGSKYDVKTLYYKATLTVPKDRRLNVESKYSLLKIGDLEADLNLDIYRSELDIGKVRHLRANLNSSFTAVFKEMETAQFSAKNSFINIEKAKVLNIGFVELMDDSNKKNDTNSSLSEYRITEVEMLNIAETKNDKFKIGKVGKLSAPSSIFSNYEIEELTGSINLNARSGDLSVREVANNFGHINIENEISTVILKMATECNYLLNVFENPTSEYFFPSNLKKIKEEKDWKTTYLKGNKTEASEIDIRCEKCKVVFQD